MPDKWDEIKGYVEASTGQINILAIHRETGIARSTIRGLLKKYAPQVRPSHRVIDWGPIEEDIMDQQDLGVIDDKLIAEKYDVPYLTIQQHRCYKMGIGVNKEFTVEKEEPRLSLVSDDYEAIVKRAVEIKRENLELLEPDFERWLRGPAGQEFLFYLQPLEREERDEYLQTKDEG